MIDSLQALPPFQKLSPGKEKVSNRNGVQELCPMDTERSSQDIRDICKLYGSEALNKMMKQIKYYGNKKRPSAEMLAGVEVDPEYCLIVEANTLAVEIDNEICKFFCLIIKCIKSYTLIEFCLYYLFYYFYFRRLIGCFYYLLFFTFLKICIYIEISI